MALRRNSQRTRCMTCMVHTDNCYCDKVERLKLITKVSFVMFKKERFLPSNTANLALNTLENSKVFHRGIQDQFLPKDFLEESEYSPLLLYPGPEAQVLAPEVLKKFKLPINLIIPDGTWRQAKKTQAREPYLRGVPTVILPPTPKSIYPLRRQKFDHGLATFEAMAYALGIIEGHETQEILMENFKVMIEAHLVNRVILEKEGPL